MIFFEMSLVHFTAHLKRVVTICYGWKTFSKCSSLFILFRSAMVLKSSSSNIHRLLKKNFFRAILLERMHHILFPRSIFPWKEEKYFDWNKWRHQ